MKTIRLYVDTVQGQRREVEFIGDKVSSRRTPKEDDHTWGATETEYCTEDGRRIIYVEQWRVGQQNDPTHYILTEFDMPDLPSLPVEAFEADCKRLLTLDEALALSIPAKWVDD